MRYLTLIAASALLAGALVGCSKSDSAMSSDNKSQGGSGATASNTSDDSLVGTWQGELKMPEASKDDPGAAMAKGLGDMMAGMMNLEIHKDQKFTMSMMMIPIDGSYTREGNTLTLTPEKIMGMTPEEFKKTQSKNNPAASTEDMSKPMKMVLSEDGKELALEPEKGKESQGSMVFKKGEPKPTKEVVSKVSGDVETGLVGSFKADLRVDESKITAKEKEELPMVRGMLSSSKLDLLADKTFTISLVVKMHGDWSVDGDVLTLDITGVDGMPGGKSSSKEEPMKFKILDGGKTLHIIPGKNDKSQSDAVQNSLYFVKQ